MGEFVLLLVIIGLITWCLWPMIKYHRNLKKSSGVKGPAEKKD